jgi:UbiD family decarboxylase
MHKRVRNIPCVVDLNVQIKSLEATIMILWGDLRGWLAEVEKIGELVKIEEPTDWNEEISGITYLVGKKKGGPALLFDNINGYPKGHRVLSNILGSSLNRIALALGLPLNLSELDMIRMTKDIYKSELPRPQGGAS